MSTELKLKRRETGENIILSTAQFRAILALPEADAKDRLYELFEQLSETEATVHDKRWLEQIINFIPLDREGKPKRVPFTSQAKWLKLAERVVALDDQIEGTFTLSDYQETIMWERLNSDEFTITGMPSAFVGFVLDFLDATGRRFADMEPEKDEAEKPEKKENPSK